MSIIVKLTIVVTYVGGLLRYKSHASLIMWSHNVSWQYNNVIPPLTQDL